MCMCVCVRMCVTVSMFVGMCMCVRCVCMCASVILFISFLWLQSAHQSNHDNKVRIYERISLANNRVWYILHTIINAIIVIHGRL